MNDELIRQLQEANGNIFTPVSDEEVKVRNAGKPVDIILLMNRLVADSGPSATVEGELVRAIGKIGYRYYNDGDYFYKGYGKETAGPAYRYLKSKAGALGIAALRSALTSMRSRAETDAEYAEGGPYETGLKAAEQAIVDYVVAKAEQYTPNTEDMLDF